MGESESLELEKVERELLSLVAASIGGAGGGGAAAEDGEPFSLSRDTPLTDAGLDSIAAVDLRDRLSGAFGVEVPATAVFDYPSVAALAGFVVSRRRAALIVEKEKKKREEQEAEEERERERERQRQAAAAAAATAAAAASATPAPVVVVTAASPPSSFLSPPLPPRSSQGNEPIAILGFSCSLPGESASSSPSLSPFFLESLFAGRDPVAGVPAERWSPDTEEASSTLASLPAHPRFAAFLSRSAAAFDAAAFRVTGPDASALDPQARLLLEASAAALAALPPSAGEA